MPTKNPVISIPEIQTRFKAANSLRLTVRGGSIARRASASVRKAHPDTMETQKKTSPLKDIKSFFSPNGAGAGASNPGAAKAKAIPMETAMPNKLDFAATAPVAGPGPAPSSSEPAAGVNPRGALATVATGVTGAANPVANRRDSDLTAPDGNSPAPSVGFTTPAHGLRAAHAGQDPADTPLATDTDAVRRAIPTRRETRHVAPVERRSIPQQSGAKISRRDHSSILASFSRRRAKIRSSRLSLLTLSSRFFVACSPCKTHKQTFMTHKRT